YSSDSVTRTAPARRQSRRAADRPPRATAMVGVARLAASRRRGRRSTRWDRVPGPAAPRPRAHPTAARDARRASAPRTTTDRRAAERPTPLTTGRANRAGSRVVARPPRRAPARARPAAPPGTARVPARCPRRARLATDRRLHAG